MPIAVTWAEVRERADVIAERWRHDGITSVYGVPRGGVAIATYIAARNDWPLADEPTAGCLVVDDLVDSGRTAARYDRHAFDALYRKPWSPTLVAPRAEVRDDWLVFPWEAAESGPEDAVVRLLEYIGEDPTREGLLETPSRVVRALAEMTNGTHEDVAALLATTFEVPYSQMVVVAGIEFTSLCEHHLLPFSGTCDVGYIPSGRVVGLSKIPRLVEAFAKRLQIQERLTDEIAEALAVHLSAEGVGVIVRAVHSCMSCRGVRSRADMVTSAMLGALFDKPAARAEFLSLAAHAR